MRGMKPMEEVVDGAHRTPLSAAGPATRPPGPCAEAGLSVLVADDDPVNRLLASEMLRTMGIHPLLAADGAQAAALAAEQCFDLILMDIQMPVLDGLGATRRIRAAERAQARPPVPVIAYTSGHGSALPWVEAGLDGLLHKPCSLAELRSCVQRWCPPVAG